MALGLSGIGSAQSPVHQDPSCPDLNGILGAVNHSKDRDWLRLLACMRRIKSADAIPRLLPLTADQDEHIASSAAGGIVNCLRWHQSETTKTIKILLNRPHASVRNEALRFLGQVKWNSSLQAEVIRIAHHDDAEANRIAALYVLGGWKKGREEIEKALSDESESVRGAAKFVLQNFDASSHVPISVGPSTAPVQGPLGAEISIEFPGGSFREFLTAINQRVRLDFTVIQGLGDCRVAAYLQDIQTRELMRMLLETDQGLSFQQLGRSNHYTITRLHGGPECPPKSDKVARAACVADGAGLICEDGGLASLAQILHRQTGANILVWNEAVDYPVTLKTRQTKVEEIIKSLQADTALDVHPSGTENSYVFSKKVPIADSYNGAGGTDTIGTPPGQPRQRSEPQPNPTFPNKPE